MNRGVSFVLVAAVHLVLLALLFGVANLRGCKKKEREEVVEVSLADLPPPPPTAEPQPTEPPPPPTRAAVSATPRPTRTPTPTPKATRKPTPTQKKPTAKPTKKPTRKLKTADAIRTRIAQTPRPTLHKPRPTVRPMSEAQIRAAIEAGLPATSGGSSNNSGGGTVSMDSLKGAVYRKFKSAWVEPEGVSSSMGLVVKTEIEIDRSGRVIGTRILRKSHHPELDRSVETALNAVGFVEALPSGYSGASKTFKMEFKITEN